MSESGGSGLGDPIERAPDLVRADVSEGITSPAAAEKVYCVALDSKTIDVDHKATRQLRNQRRTERLEKGIPALDFIRTNIQKRRKKQLPELILQFLDETAAFSPAFRDQLLAEEQWAASNHTPIGGAKIQRTLFELTPYVNIAETDQGLVAVCSLCSFAYCNAEENYKLYCLIYERQPKEVYLGEWFTNDGDWAVYREFYCPECGTQVEVDQCPAGIPIIPDAQVALNPNVA
jgi:hypothetical protein